MPITKEAKIGAVCLLALVLLALVTPTVSTRDSAILNNDYFLIFNDVCGLTVGNGVQLAGTSIGRISSIDFTDDEDKKTFGPDANIVVGIVTDIGVQIPVDSSASIVTQQTGSRWIDILPGIASNYLETNRKYKLKVNASTLDPIGKAVNGIRQFGQSTQNLTKKVEDPTFTRHIRDLASNARFYSNEVSIVTGKTHGYLQDIEKNLDEKQSQLERQIERTDVQVTSMRQKVHEYAEYINTRVDSAKLKTANLSLEFERMAEVANRETARYQQLATQMEKEKLSPEKLQQLCAKLHKQAVKLDELAGMAQDLHDITKAPEAKQALSDLVRSYRDMAAKLRETIEKIESKLPGDGQPSQVPAPTHFDPEPTSHAPVPVLKDAPAPSPGQAQELPADTTLNEDDPKVSERNLRNSQELPAPPSALEY